LHGADLQKPTLPQGVKRCSPDFMKLEGSLPCSQPTGNSKPKLIQSTHPPSKKKTMYAEYGLLACHCR
jgi:hypothetical protein